MQCNIAILRVNESDAKSYLSIAEREQYRHEVSISEGRAELDPAMPSVGNFDEVNNAI